MATNTAYKAAIVLGISGGAAESLVMHLLEQGWTVFGTIGSRSVSIKHENLVVWQLDVLSENYLDPLIDEISKTFTYLDLFVDFIGTLPGKSLDDYEEDKIKIVMDVNFVSTALIIRRLLPMFSNGSNIILISSISSERGSYDPIYAASKGAMNSFVKSLATWLAPKIRTNAIAPSLIKSSVMYEEMLPERRALQLKQCPMDRFLSGEELAKIILDIIQPHWSHLNGVILRLNGGIYV